MEGMTYRGLVLLVGVVAVGGCEGAFFGQASVYVWNGTQSPAQVSLDGRTPVQLSLAPETGRLLTGLVAGPYTRVENGVLHPAIPLSKDHFVIINVGSKGCFARNDVAGMYKRGKAPVRVLETYKLTDIIDIADVVQIKPGQPMPLEAPRSPFTFQRVVVLPCNMLEGEIEETHDEVARYVRRLR